METFLASVNLSKYHNVFVENGVDDLEIILELDDKHLEQMNIPLGHKLKLMKRIKDMRRDRGMSVPESRQGGTRPNVSSAEVDGGTKMPDRNPATKKRTDLEELPDPTGGIYTSGAPMGSNASAAASSSTRPDMPEGFNARSNGGKSLLEGNYDEAASH